MRNLDDTPTYLYAAEERESNSSAYNDHSVRQNGYPNELDTQAVVRPRRGLLAGKSCNLPGTALHLKKALAIMSLSFIGLAVLLKSRKSTLSKETEVDKNSEGRSEKITMNVYQADGVSERAKLPESVALKRNSRAPLLELLLVAPAVTDAWSESFAQLLKDPSNLKLEGNLNDQWKADIHEAGLHLKEATKLLTEIENYRDTTTDTESKLADTIAKYIEAMLSSLDVAENEERAIANALHQEPNAIGYYAGYDDEMAVAMAVADAMAVEDYAMAVEDTHQEMAVDYQLPAVLLILGLAVLLLFAVKSRRRQLRRVGDLYELGPLLAR